MEKGKIVKVSGPLVVAIGLKNAKMYDLVKVGYENLMGEIIEVRGDRVSIQVYEETTGLGPGDPVLSTDEPLSVELGPGLISSIYDGVQRPLDLILKQVGDYITRGINVPGIDLEKKWDFKPSVSKGSKVISGDIIGVVQETPIIEHRIMVPPGIEGEVKEIKAGKFAVEEAVAIVETQKREKVEVKMLQRWSVRKPRPYKRRLSPSAPLVSGQRVIDTFFPLTKGGTACVPGPFGSGKCVSGDTPVFLVGEGIIPIKQVFEKYKNKGRKAKREGEEYTILDEPLEIFSYIQGKLRKNKVTAVYKGKSKKLMKIQTKTGRRAKVTPVHKLLKIENDLTTIKVEAQDLKKGDYIISPRKLDFTGKVQKIPVTEIFGELRASDEEVLKKVSYFIDELAAKFGSKKKVAEALNINYDVLIGYYLRRNKPTVNFVEKLYQKADSHFPELTKIKGEKQSKETKIPPKFTPKLATFLGLLFGGGSTKRNTVIFYNNDEKMLSFFEKLAGDLFGLTAKRGIANTVKCSSINSSVLTKFLEFFGYPEYQKSRSCSPPDILYTSPAEVIGTFLGGYFACDGYFHSQKGEIEFSTASKKMRTGLVYLLLRLGIINRVSTKTVGRFTQQRLFISGRDEVKRFYRSCALKNIPKFEEMRRYLSYGRRGYTSLDVVPLGVSFLKEIYSRANKPYTRLKKRGVEIHNYLSGELMSKRVFKKFAKVIGHRSLSQFAFNHLSHVYCDKVVKVEQIDDHSEVYDLEVLPGHNFVGGDAPLIFSNTVIQHQLSKWTDAEIVIFIGCGERGNEMTDVLIEFPRLTDPYSGEPLMKRTVLVANTSNMPVAAREASIYTGITMAEYFRDMGYNVALQADSTSRWAEALREISGRLEEMPGEEGFPAYLGSRLAEFYERAGKVSCLGSSERQGSITVIGSVSPPGGDLSEPVVQNTLRTVRTFWGLEDRLAYERHFPAINWLISYSLYIDKIKEYWDQEVSEDFKNLHDQAMAILQSESELKEIVRLVGVEALSFEERLILDTAKSIREDFLQQNAFHEVDTFTSLEKQNLMLRAIMTFHKEAVKALDKGISLEDIISLEVKEEIARAKFIPEESLEELEKLQEELVSAIDSLAKEET